MAIRSREARDELGQRGPHPVWSREIFRHAAEHYPEEACGVVVVGPAGLVARRFANLAVDSRRGFALDSLKLSFLTRDLDGGGGLVAVYHSHPDGDARLSFPDRRLAIGVAQLVVGVSATGVTAARWFEQPRSASGWVEVDLAAITARWASPNRRCAEAAPRGW